MTIEKTENAEKVTLKKMVIASAVNFFDLPKEDTGFTIEKSESNKLKTCDKLHVTYTRLYLKQIYGSKKDKIERNKENIAKLGKFLLAFYQGDNDEEKDKTETYQQFLERYAVSKVQLVLNQRARLEALRLENADIDKNLASMETLATAGKYDADAIAEMRRILAIAEKAAGMVSKEAEKAEQEQETPEEIEAAS
jgi:hypothetical protein